MLECSLGSKGLIAYLNPAQAEAMPPSGPESSLG